MLSYRWRHGRWPQLARPSRFTELVQRRKLDGGNPDWARLVDKVTAKEHVAARLGREWVIPTLWTGSTLPPVPPVAPTFVVKARHGCRQNRFVRSEGEDWSAIRRTADGWMRRGYGGWLDEPLYAAVPRGLLIEPFIGETERLPVDWKFYVFGGEVAAVQVHLERETRHRWLLFDRDWRRLSAGRGADVPPPPASLPAMIAAAERLGEGIDFVRIDFYERFGRPLFGEMTFYPGSGYDPFDPVSLDAALGARWSAASASASATASAICCTEKGLGRK